MAFDCGFARVYLWETKSLAKNNVKRKQNETAKAYKSRILDERYRLYMENFKKYPRLQVSKSKCLSMMFLMAHVYKESSETYS